ncbi:MAG: prepilin-type N-terminal cleavage/methylation domain-containing protein [Planctomycetes bacterium]|nr:prepilin-type N-terminal cleavage/methylation domain-containing protein [Planctomycetota bacterium]
MTDLPANLSVAEVAGLRTKRQAALRILANSATEPSATAICRRYRRGFTLMEVILAMTVLSITLGMIYSVASRGSRYGMRARQETKAQLLCESKLAEISAGITPAAEISGAVSEVDDGWRYSVDIEPVDELEGLVRLRVTFVENVPDRKQPVQFSLMRWIRDPAAVLPEESEAAVSDE